MKLLTDEQILKQVTDMNEAVKALNNDIEYLMREGMVDTHLSTVTGIVGNPILRIKFTKTIKPSTIPVNGEKF